MATRSDATPTQQRVRQILTDLDRVRENLLALSDDIWLSIDHNDEAALDQGYAFKKQYNARMVAFDRLASELSGLIQQFTHVEIETHEEGGGDQQSPDENERLIRELDREEPHRLDEDFCFKRPYGFVLQGRAWVDIKTWRGIYRAVCRHLATADPRLFAALPDDPDFVSKQGHRAFSRQPGDLRLAIEFPQGVYAEGNYSANDIRDRIRLLLTKFDVDPASLVLYLREDRDAAEDERHQPLIR